MASIVNSLATSAHSAAASLLAASPIKVGESLPDVPVKEDNPEEKISIHNIPGKIIIVGVPGAFTPPCSSQVPGYIEKYTDFAAKGVTGIYVVAVNDAFVTKAWKQKLAGSEGTPVHFIADDTASFTSKVGFVFDASPLLGGPRAKRYVIVADSGRVTHVAVEEDPTQITSTKADNVLSII
ncbi:Redoxin [Sistotremastrum suecicum HHB10207 ss-3]|uniref:Redoxin n=1 Tax=Sistotremastrum suecicum HHB10207 ss-3 TaxID=1314776 RepID=A0A166DDU6_9AGAM|nr:Redoxin [Sistotremastrum suecicum HHB10207 ss-3]